METLDASLVGSYLTIMVATNQLSSDIAGVREASRALVRELGFLTPSSDASDGLSHAECHALIEIERHNVIDQTTLGSLLRLDKSTVSRAVKALADRRLVRRAHGTIDGRRRELAITPLGKQRLCKIHAIAGKRVSAALALLAPAERDMIQRGIALYASALRRAKLREDSGIRPIESSDDRDVEALIRSVMPEFGASGPGFAIHDPEVSGMRAAYADSRAQYFVVERNDCIVGGGGFAPLSGGPDDTCELRKMYFLREARGIGLGELLLDQLLERAKEAGFSRCYLETLATMTGARRLYEKKGFQPLDRPQGKTGHFGCDRWYMRDL